MASLTLKSLASHFNLERVKKYGHQTLPSKLKINNKNYNHSNKTMTCSTSSTPTTCTTTSSSSCSNGSSSFYSSGAGSVPSCRSSKIRPQLNPNARKMAPKNKRCKASVLLDQIPVCKMQKALIKYGCCHHMMQNVISLDFYEYPPDHEHNC